MRRNTLYIIMLAGVLLSCSKQEPVDTPFEERDSEFELSLVTNIESSEMSAQTKTDLLNSGSTIPDNKLKLYGWKGDSKVIDGSTATYSSSKWTLSPGYTLDNKSSYSFLAYANLPSAGASITMPDSKTGNVSFNVTDISAAQKDVLIGKGSKASGFTDGNVQIELSHPFASVKFLLGNADGVTKVTGVSLTGVYESGSTTYSTASTVTDEVTDYTWSVPSKAGATLSATGLNVTSGEIASFVVVPQTLSSTKTAVITVTYVNGSSQTKTMTKLLNTGSWAAGYTTTYAIDRIGSISVSVSSSDGKTITNGASASKSYVRATITGAWYESSADDAAVVAPWSITDGTWTGLFPSADWTEGADGYYYLNDALAASETATTYTSYTKPSKPSGLGASAELRINVLVQAIPYDVNKTCQEAFNAL